MYNVDTNVPLKKVNDKMKEKEARACSEIHFRNCRRTIGWSDIYAFYGGQD